MLHDDMDSDDGIAKPSGRTGSELQLLEHTYGCFAAVCCGESDFFVFAAQHKKLTIYQNF